MPDFVNIVPASHQNVSAGLVETLIQARREELFTGLMRLSTASGDNYLFSFLEGTQQRLYRCHDGETHIVPRQTWPEAFDRDGVAVGILSLPLEAMRFIRVLHEVPVRHLEELTLSCEELTTAVGKWAGEQEPGILHVQGERINRYYLMAGAATPVIEELSILAGETRVSLNDAGFPKSLPQAHYQVLHYVSVNDHEVWREYELRLTFHPFMRMLLNRFGELAGRVLTERLCQQMSTWAQQGGWNVSLSSNGIVNRQYFESLESASGFYQQLMQRFYGEASPALGPRMTQAIAEEILMKLDSHRRELLNKSIFEPLGVSSDLGMVWR